MARRKDGHVEEEAVLLLHKGKRGLLRLVFSRTGVILLLLAAQICLLLAAFFRLGEYYYGSAATASLLASLVVINRPGEPTMKITWILLMFLVPVFAIPFYFYVNADLGHRLARYRLSLIEQETERYSRPDPRVREQLAERDPGFSRLCDYVAAWGGHRVYSRSDARYFPSGEDMFEEMLRQLEQARDFIFLEYFIIEEGYMWGRMLKVLEEKVRQGVEVRVLYDGTCVVGKLPSRYYRELEALGIQCHMFAPLRPLVSTHYNNRDHRKIMVIDGRCAFTGGINLADEYINRKKLYGHWKDTAVMVTGEAVAGFTLMFLQMWNVEGSDKGGYARYLDTSVPVEGPGCVLPYGDQPFDDEQVAKTVYMDILNRAVDYVYIMTPYLLLDQEMTNALVYAAKRGVDVRLILPGVPDKKTVFAMTRSYYRELIAGGVQLYEYMPGFTHGKMFVSDDTTAVVGSVNLDYRSLYHHFECAALLYGCGAVMDVKKDMEATLKKCIRLTLESCKKDKLWRRVLGWVVRPLASLM